MQMSEIENMIRKWSDDRGLIESTEVPIQLEKLKEEFCEVRDAWFDHDPIEHVMEELGDMFVVLINVAYKLGVSMEECAMMAYEKIKDRKGRIINGTFVKDA